MLKGVSQKVIEVVRTDHKYFEKAILFLRPTISEEEKDGLRTHAWNYLNDVEYHPVEQEKESLWKKVVYILLSALGGAAIATVFFLL